MNQAKGQSINFPEGTRIFKVKRMIGGVAVDLYELRKFKFTKNGIKPQHKIVDGKSEEEVRKKYVDKVQEQIRVQKEVLRIMKKGAV